MKFRTNYRRPQRHRKLKCEEGVMDSVFGYAKSIYAPLKLRDFNKEALPQALYDVLDSFHAQAAKEAAIAFLLDNYPKEIEYAIHPPDIYQEIRECEGQKSLSPVPPPVRLERAKIFGSRTQVSQRRKKNHGQRTCRIYLD